MHVSPEPLGRFVRHLDGVLQHGDGEDGAGIGGAPQPVIMVGSIRQGGVVANPLQVAHPADGDVTVLQHHPLAMSGGLHNHLLRSRTLSLTQ